MAAAIFEDHILRTADEFLRGLKEGVAEKIGEGGRTQVTVNQNSY